MTIRNDKRIEDVLDELLLERGRPTTDTIATWAKLYPEHRSALLEFAASWAEDQHLTAPRVDHDRERSVAAKAVNAFRSAVAPPAAGTLAELAATAGRTLEDVARALRIDARVVAKMNARRLDPTSIGRAVSSRIADLLQIDAARVAASWTATRGPVAAAGFLSHSLPPRGETLRQALTAVGTPSELIAELEGDGLEAHG